MIDKIFLLAILLTAQIAFCQQDKFDNSISNLSSVNQILSESTNINDFKSKVNVIVPSLRSIQKVIIRHDSLTEKSISSSKLFSILEIDIVDYFELINKNASELEEKVFLDSLKSTNSYLKLKDSLIILKKQILNTPTLISVKLSPCLYSSKYSIENETFSYQTTLLPERFLDKKYFQIGEEFESICITKPEIFSFDEGFVQDGNGYFIQRAHIPVSPASTALKIEKNCNSTELYFILKLEDVITKKHPRGFSMNFLTSKALSYFIINNSNGQILYKKIL